MIEKTLRLGACLRPAAQANAQVGDFAQAAKILEYEMQFQPPSSELYFALADVYQRQGNVAKAEDFKRQAARLSN